MDPTTLLLGARSNVDRYLTKINEDVVTLEEQHQFLTDQLKEIEGSLDIIRDLKANILKQSQKPVTNSPSGIPSAGKPPTGIPPTGIPPLPTPTTTTTKISLSGIHPTAPETGPPKAPNPISVIIGALPSVKEEDGEDADLELPDALLSAVMNAAKNKE